MTHWLDERYRHETVIVRTLWVTIALSLLVHFADLFLWLPRAPLLTPRGEEQELANDRLQVRLAAIPKTAGAETPPVAIAKAEPNAGLEANLPVPATGVGTQDSKRGGGIFEIRRMDYDDAAFEFFGWNNEMGRKTPQLIEVRKGNNSDMRIAVVRKMIAIIREHSKEDFVWHSPRRDSDLVLSARLSDNAAL